METVYENNKLIKKTMLSMFGGSLAAMVTMAIALMVDTVLAGALLNQNAIAAVAVATPIVNIMQALTQAIINGASIKMSIFAGKGDKEGIRSSFSVAVFFTVIMGLVFIGLCQLFAQKLVFFFGGSGDHEVAKMAVWYLRGASGCILFGTLNLFVTKILALFGQQKTVLRMAIIGIVGNVLFSVILVKLLPDDISIMALGFGTWMSGAIACTYGILSLCKQKISLKFSLKDIDFKKLMDFVHHGIPSSGNNLADGVVSGIVNNSIVNLLPNGVVALAVYTAVKSVVTFATAIIQATNLSAAPMFGIMYGSRDKNGILRSYGVAFKLALTSIAICSLVVIAISPVLANVFDMKSSVDFYIGICVCMLVYLPITAFVRITTQLFEAMEKPGMGLMYSIIPDSIIYPIMLIVLLPVLKYNGIWISFSLNAIPFLIIMYIVRSVKNKTCKLNMERMLCINEEIRDNVPKLDISIKSDNSDVTFISEKVHKFLMEEKYPDRSAYVTALCLEELAADFVEHSDENKENKKKDIIMDIKLFSDEDELHIIIRNESFQYNPLDFEIDKESFKKTGVKLAQKLAKSIEYNYVYNMNVVTINIAK